MTHINVNTLSQSLIKKFTRIGITKAREHAIKLAQKISNIAQKWQDDIYERLSKPAVNRGYYKRSKLWLKLHNNHRYNTSFPMMMSGKLRNSIYQNVSVKVTKFGATITVNRGFRKLSTGEVGGYRDYGEYLNQKHGQLYGWKERAYAKLDARIKRV